MTRCTATMNSTLRAALFSSIPAMKVSKRSPSRSPEAHLRCIPPMTASTPMAAAARWGSAAREAAEQMEYLLLRIFLTGICHPCRIPRRAECLRCREKCPERLQQTERCPDALSGRDAFDAGEMSGTIFNRRRDVGMPSQERCLRCREKCRNDINRRRDVGMPSQGEMPSTPGEMPGTAQAENSDTDDTATNEKNLYPHQRRHIDDHPMRPAGTRTALIPTEASILTAEHPHQSAGDGTNNAVITAVRAGANVSLPAAQFWLSEDRRWRKSSAKTVRVRGPLQHRLHCRRGPMFSLLDQEGEEIISYTPECSYSSVSFSLRKNDGQGDLYRRLR